MHRLWRWLLKDSNPVSLLLQAVSLTCFIIGMVEAIQANMAEPIPRSSVPSLIWVGAGLVALVIALVVKMLVNRAREEKGNPEP